MHLLSDLRRILTAAVATLLLTWLGGNLLVTAVGIVRSHLVAADVEPLVVRLLPGVVEVQDELVASAGRDADREWIEQACSFTADESGWMAIRHRETCVLRSVTAWEVASEQEARDLLPVREVTRWDHRGCVTLGAVGDVGVESSPQVTYVVSTGSDGGPWCIHSLNDPDGTRELDGRRRVIGSGRWVVAVTEHPLVDVAIGCARWTVVFCDNPWVRHALVDRPEG